MATIDILCVIDTNGLMKRAKDTGTLSTPINLAAVDASTDTFVFMICDGQYACNNQGKSELMINANVGDTVRWTITDPSTGLTPGEDSKSFSCILYNFKSGGEGTVLTTPVLNSAPAISYYNSLTSITTPVAAAYMCSSWNSSIVATGNIQYDWAFQVVDNATGEVVGYYTWDPYINVKKAPVTSMAETV